MSDTPAGQLSRRERQIMDILFELGEATAEEVRERLPDPPSYSAARTLLTRLEAKGHVRHGEKGLRYVYSPTMSRQEAQEKALSRIVRVFFNGSLTQAVNGLLDLQEELPPQELERLARAIEDARKRRGKRR